MNRRERVLAALNHKEPDRVPFDLGGTRVTGIQARAYEKLRQFLGLPEKEIRIIDIYQQLAQVDDDVMETLGVDVRNISPHSSADFVSDIKDAVDSDYIRFYDEYHIGWRMPKDNGLYYDMFDHPLGGDIKEGDVDDYQLPDPLHPSRYANLREAARRVIDEEQRALIIGSMSAGMYELYMWTRGYKDGYADWAANPTLVNKILHGFLDLQVAYWDKMFDTLQGIPIDVVHTADDMAGQHAMLISPRSYRKMLKPLHKALFDFIHSKTDAKIFFHSCGAIRSIIPDLIEVGVDIINPVQVSATGMDSAELKREFGKDLTFWGGGVDTQNAFDDKHTPDEVRADVRRRLEDLMPGGGFVFNTVHNIQGNVPPENIMAMWETLQEFGKYSNH
jgi:uroporphyrinogen decarboxylase